MLEKERDREGGEVQRLDEGLVRRGMGKLKWRGEEEEKEEGRVLVAHDTSLLLVSARTTTRDHPWGINFISSNTGNTWERPLGLLFTLILQLL